MCTKYCLLVEIQALKSDSSTSEVTVDTSNSDVSVDTAVKSVNSDSSVNGSSSGEKDKECVDTKADNCDNKVFCKFESSFLTFKQ